MIEEIKTARDKKKEASIKMQSFRGHGYCCENFFGGKCNCGLGAAIDYYSKCCKELDELIDQL